MSDLAAVSKPSTPYPAATLTLTSAEGELRTFTIAAGVTSIGRSADNQVALPGDKKASRRHAEIRHEEGAFVLHDLGSSNGTFVGQERVSHHVLQAGDDIRIGDTVLVFSLLQPEPAIEPESAAVPAEPLPAGGSSDEDAAGSVDSLVPRGKVAEAEVDRLLVLAERAEREGHVADALSLYRQSLTCLSPASPLSREVQSICQELEDQLAPVASPVSAQVARPAPVAVSPVEERPDEVRSMVERAEQMEQAGNIAGAVGLYQDLLYKLPATSPLRQEIAMIHAAAEARQAGRDEAGRLVTQAQRLEDQGDVEGALAVYRQAAVEAPPGSALRRELELVITDLMSHSRDQVRLDMAAGHRAEGLAAAGRWPDASAAYEELLADTTDPATRSRWEARLAHCQEEMVLADLFQRGVTASHARDWQQAHHLFSQITRRRPGYQYNGQMAALWLTAVDRHLSPPRKGRLAVWSAAGGVLVLLVLILVVVGAFSFTRHRQTASATAIAKRVATLQALQTLTAVAARPSPNPLPTMTLMPTPPPPVAVAPVGSLAGTIAFASDRTGNWDVYTVRPDGTQLTRLTDHNATDTHPAWSPDGRRLAFVSDRDGNPDIYVMAADGSGVKRLTADAAVDTSPAWSPDGQRIVFASNREAEGDTFDLWLMDADGAGLTKLAVLADEPDWSPDGGRVVAVFRFPTVTTIGLVAVQADAVPQPLLEMPDSASPAWSPDGSRILFSAPVAGERHIFRINADGSDVVDMSATLGAGGLQPTWSPDGQYLAYVAEADGNQDIYVAPTASGRPFRLTTDPGTDALPCWSR